MDQMAMRVTDKAFGLLLKKFILSVSVLTYHSFILFYLRTEDGKKVIPTVMEFLIYSQSEIDTPIARHIGDLSLEGKCKV